MLGWVPCMLLKYERKDEHVQSIRKDDLGWYFFLTAADFRGAINRIVEAEVEFLSFS